MKTPASPVLPGAAGERWVRLLNGVPVEVVAGLGQERLALLGVHAGKFPLGRDVVPDHLARRSDDLKQGHVVLSSL